LSYFASPVPLMLIFTKFLPVFNLHMYVCVCIYIHVYVYIYIYIYIHIVLGTEHRALCLLGKPSTTWAMPSALIYLFIFVFEIGYHWFCLGWVQIHKPLASLSFWVAGIVKCTLTCPTQFTHTLLSDTIYVYDFMTDINILIYFEICISIWSHYIQLLLDF
jgi:hypothetical protein